MICLNHWGEGKGRTLGPVRRGGGRTLLQICGLPNIFFLDQKKPIEQPIQKILCMRRFTIGENPSEIGKKEREIDSERERERERERYWNGSK